MRLRKICSSSSISLFFSAKDEKGKLIKRGPYWTSGPGKPPTSFMKTLSAVVTGPDPPPIPTELSVGEDRSENDVTLEKTWGTDDNFNVVKESGSWVEAKFIEVRRTKKEGETKELEPPTKKPRPNTEEGKVGQITLFQYRLFENEVFRPKSRKRSR